MTADFLRHSFHALGGYVLYSLLKTDNWLFMEGCTKNQKIRVITKLPNSEQSYKDKVKTHNYINRQNQSTTGKL